MKKVAKTLFRCDKCSKEIEYREGKEYHLGFDFKSNECWSVNLGSAGYGSRLDGCEVVFDICDDCLTGFIDTFNHADVVYNSGSNTWVDYDEDSCGDEE